MPDQLAIAGAAVARATEVVDTATATLARGASTDGRLSVEKLDAHQMLAYDLAHAASALEGCRVMLTYGEHGEIQSKLARVFIADAIADIGARLIGRDGVWGTDSSELTAALPFVESHRSPMFLEQLADELPAAGTGPRNLPEEFELAAETFHRFADDKIRPVAEHVHRTNADVPEDIIAGLAELGFRHVLCVRRPETFEAARAERLTVSGKPGQYDDLDRFIAEQELLRRLAGESALRFVEIDVSDDDVPRAADRIADWLEASGGLYGPSGAT